MQYTLTIVFVLMALVFPTHAELELGADSPLSTLDSTRNLVALSESQEHDFKQVLSTLPVQLPAEPIIKITRSNLAKNQYMLTIYDTTADHYHPLSAIGLHLLAVVTLDPSKRHMTIDGYLIKPFEGVELLTTELSDEYDSNMFDFNEDDRIIRFDFAQYKITNDLTAFGIRTGHNEGYSGGGSYSEMLHLFTYKDGTISLIASVLDSHSSDLAGEWTDDGFRTRVRNSQNWVVVMSSNMTNGHYDIILREIDTPSNTVLLQWNTETEKYQLSNDRSAL